MDFSNELEAVLQNRDAVTMRGDFGIELFAKRMQNGEMALSMKCATGWELIALIGGACEYSRVLFSCVAETVAETLRDAAQAAPTCEAMPAVATSQIAAPAIASAPRCAHFKSIKRAFAVARDRGLDTRADAAMRAAFGRYLGRAIESRSAMNGADWSLIGTAVKAGELAW